METDKKRFEGETIHSFSSVFRVLLRYNQTFNFIKDEAAVELNRVCFNICLLSYKTVAEHVDTVFSYPAGWSPVMIVCREDPLEHIQCPL